MRATLVELALLRQAPQPALIEQASKAAPESLEFNEDLHFSIEDRRELTIVYVKRALTEAMQRSHRGQYQTAP